jgi:hypothetical protein
MTGKRATARPLLHCASWKVSRSLSVPSISLDRKDWRGIRSTPFSLMRVAGRKRPTLREKMSRDQISNRRGYRL